MVRRNKNLPIGLIQHACTENRAANLRATLAGVREAVRRGARLILLQELHRHSYFCKTEDPKRFEEAEPIPGPTTRALAAVAKKHRVVIVGSLFERRAPGLYHNTAVVLDSDGRIAGRYRKMHIPDDPGFQEKFYFTPGDLGFTPVDTSLGRLGVLVCWDQWFPEAARAMALAGAEILLYPTAIGWDPKDNKAEKQRQRESWQLIQRAHAVANGLPVAACNRVGREPHPGGRTYTEFWGSSFVCGPQGEMLWEGPADKAAVGVVEIAHARTEQVRRIWPFLRDRRIDAYESLLKRYDDDGDR
jgi:N-carbamoylputrescine amidase